MPNTTPREETASVGSQEANVHLEKHARSSTTRTRKAKKERRGVTSPSPTGSPHRNSNADGRCSDDGSAEGTPKFTGKSPSGKANRLPCTNFKKGSSRRTNS